MVTDTENRYLDDKDSRMTPLIYPEDSDNKESPNNPLSAEIIPEPVPPSKNPTDELTLEPYYDALSEPCAPTREGSMEHLPPKYIMRYDKGSDTPIFSTVYERTKEDP